MSHLLREKQFVALGDGWAAQGEEDGAAVVGKEERVGILRGGQLRVRPATRNFIFLYLLYLLCFLVYVYEVIACVRVK